MKFVVSVRFNIPDIIIEPTLEAVQDSVNKVALYMVETSKNILWWAEDSNESFFSTLAKEPGVSNLMEEISSTTMCMSKFTLLCKVMKRVTFWKPFS